MVLEFLFLGGLGALADDWEIIDGDGKPSLRLTLVAVTTGAGARMEVDGCAGGIVPLELLHAVSAWNDGSPEAIWSGTDPVGARKRIAAALGKAGMPPVR
jgi:hypothetical protein